MYKSIHFNKYAWLFNQENHDMEHYYLPKCSPRLTCNQSRPPDPHPLKPLECFQLLYFCFSLELHVKRIIHDFSVFANQHNILRFIHDTMNSGVIGDQFRFYIFLNKLSNQLAKLLKREFCELIGFALNPQIKLQITDILRLFYLPIHEYGISLHFFKLSLISVSSELQSSVA